MKLLSTRYALAVCFLLALALVPTVIHSYIDAKVDDGKSVNNIATSLNNYSSAPAKRNASWGLDVFGSADWFERDYQDQQYNKIRLFTARSYDHKRLYHHPELALSYGKDLTKQGIKKLPHDSEILVHLLSNESNTLQAAYVLLYDDQFISDPINHQLGESMRLLVSAGKPMTLFYASQASATGNMPFEQSNIAQLLLLAIQSFQAQSN